ncbi:gamma-glutamyltransferase family protein [Variovorax arabinosiphilus]|uniref:gamma-glutamyltransferase family protein n=1 Tax=Variovorax arabinosiphilus TaxID=3053498 RepID=UPI0025781EC7|nr:MULTISPECIES: gamma-glutamyltransferase family protein [unclassified Variovorax]MDM0120204.1 gamma-glutamyltransferase family protein [Variovorax sp. J2L1-78]MDM0127884.1 gamma-glutamyltransferase family protein [Variovorax sp. J2L1-63]MDM0231583.1 gamma-glutamyltransferase family protein [Variovorax sp. J2R1-6]
MKRNLPWRALTPTALALTLLACGGGGSDNGSAPATPTPPPVAVDNSCLTSTTATPVVVGSGDAGDPAAPEPASGYVVGHKIVSAKTFMVVANHPLATKAGCDVLKAGGSAADAAIAVQAVLGLVEPQSSSLAGGAFMLYYDAKTKKVQAYDGRETAPAAATANYLRYVDDTTDQTLPKPSARASGRSIGTPGVMRMLEMAHGDHGKLAWKDLFGEGTRLASDGFKIGGRMAAAIASSASNLKRDAEAAAYFLDAAGNPKPLGTTLTNPAYAEVLKAMASQGANALYTGKIAEDIVAKIQITAGADGSVITPGKTTLDDLKNYKPMRREPVCTTYRAYYVCSMSPPSSGGIGVLSTLGILENFNMGLHAPSQVDLEGGKPSVMGVHLVAEAERLAYADRDKYVADTDFVPLPGGSADTLLNKTYMRSRANLIDFSKSMGTAVAGDFGVPPVGIDKTVEHGTTHYSIVDKEGNVASMTTTVESTLGSYHMSHGIMLNNQLTDFSANPIDPVTNAPVANRVAPGKRPRSTMAPTLVFNGNQPGDFLMATGSPGGGTIIQYVVKTVVGALDWGLDAQQATSLVDFGATNSPSTNVGGEHPNVDITNGGNNDPLILGLRALGHTVATGSQSSGISTIIRKPASGGPILTGGADPRREGIVLGDTFTP